MGEVKVVGLLHDHVLAIVERVGVHDGEDALQEAAVAGVAQAIDGVAVDVVVVGGLVVRDGALLPKIDAVQHDLQQDAVGPAAAEGARVRLHQEKVRVGADQVLDAEQGVEHGAGAGREAVAVVLVLRLVQVHGQKAHLTEALPVRADVLVELVLQPGDLEERVLK